MKTLVLTFKNEEGQNVGIRLRYPKDNLTDAQVNTIIHKNLFLNNRAQNAGGGIFVGHSASVRNITGLFWPRANCPPSGVNASGTWTYQGNTFSGNTHQNGQDSDGAQVYFN